MHRRIVAAAVVASSAVLVAPLASADITSPNARARGYVPMRQTKLIRGDGSANAIAVTRDGRHAVVLQGDVYGSRGLVRLNLRRSPAKVTGVNRHIKGRGLDHVVVRGNRFAYATSGRQLVVSRINRRKPKIIRRIKYSKRVTQLAITPNGRWLYAARDVGLNDARIFVYRIKKNGIPRRRRVMKRMTVTGLAVTPNGNHLIVGGRHRLRVFTLRHPSRPKKQGKAVKVGIVSPNAMAFSRNSRFAYAMADDAITVVRVNLRRRKQVRRKVLSRYDFSGDIALSRNGKRLLVLNGHAGVETPSIYLLNWRLKVKQAFDGACFPRAAAASWHGSTKGRFYLADSGICTNQALFTPLRPS